MSDISTPIYPTLPAQKRALEVATQRLNPLVPIVGAPVVNGLNQYNLTRVLNGTVPLNTQETFGTLRSLQLNEPYTPARERGIGITDILGNALSDVRQIVSSIPKLPMMLTHELQSIPKFQEEYNNALESTGNPIAALAASPGLRLLPLSYTIGNLASGNADELLRHPVMTGLDVLPAAKGLKLGERVAAIPAVESLSDTLKTTARRTEAGQAILKRFGKDARGISEIEAVFTDRLRELINPEGKELSKYEPRFHIDAQLKRDTASLRKKYMAEMDEPERVAVFEALTHGDTSTLSAAQLAAYNQYSTLLDNLTNRMVAEKYLTQIDGEVYDPRIGKKILSARYVKDQAVLGNEIRNTVINPGAVTPNDLLTQIDNVLASRLNLTDKNRLLQGVSYTLDQLGYDGVNIRRYLRTIGKNGGGSWSDVRLQFENAFNAGAGTPVLTPEFITDQFKAHAKTDPQLARVYESMRNGRYTDARKRTNQLLKTKALVKYPWLKDAYESLQIISQRDKFLAKTDSFFSDKALAKIAERHDKILKSNAPDRFLPEIRRQADQSLLAKYSTDPNFPLIEQAIKSGVYASYPGLGKEFVNSMRSIEKTWMDMRAQGFDPVFVHEVAPSKTSLLDSPRVLETVRDPGSSKARIRDVTPYVRDPFVALDAQALELIQREVNKAMSEEIISTFGRTHHSLIEEYLPDARRLMLRNPSLDLTAHLTDLISREWVRYNPETFGMAKARVGDLAGENSVFVPRAVYDNLELMHTPRANKLTAILDPVMNLFRTSVLALSPRWHINNIFGGGMMAAVEDPRILAKLGESSKMLKAGGFVDSTGKFVPTPELIESGMGSMPRELLDWNRRGILPSESRAAEILHRFAAGRTLRRLVGYGQAATDVSYRFNGTVDAMYRGAAFLQGRKGALAKGMTEEAAHAAGMELVRKVFQSWDRMTPFERQTMRYVFPFYGFVSHIMKYVLRYPFDHPLRASVMASFTRNELEDYKLYGDKFLNAFFLGNMDKNGNRLTFSTSGINPYGQVADYFTLAGFVGNANPILQTFLEQLGVDTTTGGPDLYPNLIFDEKTGRLKAASPNFLTNALGAVLPQSSILLGLVGANREYKDMLRTNPEAAARMMRSSLGLPILFRSWNIPEEVAKQESARQDDQRSLFNKSLRAGSLEPFKSAYPSLSPLVNQIATLQSQGQLSGYEVRHTTPPLTSMMFDALVRQNVPLPPSPIYDPQVSALVPAQTSAQVGAGGPGRRWNV